MENKTERLLNKKVALRRLHYSHPTAIPKANQIGTKAREDEDLEERKKLTKSAPLLSRRSKIPVNGVLAADTHYPRKDKNGNYFSSDFIHNDIIKHDMVTFESFDAKRAHENSSPVGKSKRDGAKQIVNGRPTLLTAMQIHRCDIGNKSTKIAFHAKGGPFVLLRQDFKKLSLGSRGRLSRNEPNTLMFQQWGIRKCTRNASGKFWNNWANNELGADALSQSVYACRYKSAQDEMKKKRAPLAPNPSPSNINNAKLKRIEQDCKKPAERKSNNDGTEVKVEIILSPPQDELMKDLKKEGVNEKDLNCLSPSIDNFFRKDTEPLPSKINNHATEVTMCNGSDQLLALGDAIHKIQEDKAGDDLFLKSEAASLHLSSHT